MPSERDKVSDDKAKWWRPRFSVNALEAAVTNFRRVILYVRTLLRNRLLPVRVTAVASLMYVPLIVAEAERTGDWSPSKIAAVLAIVFLLLWGPVEMFVKLATRTGGSNK